MADPLVPDFDLQRQQALSAYQSALNAVQQHQKDLLSQSGYQYSTDANGNVQVGGIDPNNRYGAIQQMYNQQGQDLISNFNAQHARNLGAYGLGNQRASLLRYMGNAQRSQFGQGLQSQLGGYNQQLTDANRAYTDANNTIASDQNAYNASVQAANADATAVANAPSPSFEDLFHQLFGGPMPYNPSTAGVLPGGQIARSRSYT